MNVIHLWKNLLLFALYQKIKAHLLAKKMARIQKNWFIIEEFELNEEQLTLHGSLKIYIWYYLNLIS